MQERQSISAILWTVRRTLKENCPATHSAHSWRPSRSRYP
jgi:hypothetical protein